MVKRLAVTLRISVLAVGAVPRIEDGKAKAAVPAAARAFYRKPPLNSAAYM